MPTQLAASGARFEAYGTSHRVALAVLLAGVVLILLFGRRHRATPRAERLGRVLAGAVLVVTVPLQLLYFTPGYWDPAKTLPLQLCDLASMVAVYALWTRRPWAASLTYFWGLTLTTQAILTPDLASDFPDPVFLLFWAMHVLVVWAAVYLVWGLGLAPTWRTYKVAIVLTVVWAVSVFTFNVIADTNYGFLNAKPAAASVLDLLGPWPWYVAAEIAIVATFWALITWPWVARTRRHAGHPAADRPPSRSPAAERGGAGPAGEGGESGGGGGWW